MLKQQPVKIKNIYGFGDNESEMGSTKLSQLRNQIPRTDEIMEELNNATEKLKEENSEKIQDRCRC